jgi:hypothetical protein
MWPHAVYIVPTVVTSWRQIPWYSKRDTSVLIQATNDTVCTSGYKWHIKVYISRSYVSIETAQLQSPQQQLEGYMNNECSHNIMRVTHKVSGHHFHQEQQWQAAMITHWLH